MFSEVGYLGVLYSLFWLAMHHRLAGQYGLALKYCRELYVRVSEVAHEGGYIMFVYSIGMLLLSYLNDLRSFENQQAGQQAVRLLSCVSKIRSEYWAWYIRFRSADLQALELLRHRLGEALYSSAWKEGQTMNLDEAVAMALTVEIE